MYSTHLQLYTACEMFCRLIRDRFSSRQRTGLRAIVPLSFVMVLRDLSSNSFKAEDRPERELSVHL